MSDEKAVVDISGDGQLTKEITTEGTGDDFPTPGDLVTGMAVYKCVSNGCVWLVLALCWLFLCCEVKEAVLCVSKVIVMCV